MNKKGKDGKEFRQLIADVAELISGFSMGDLYPSVKFISSITGMKGKLERIVKRFDTLMDPIIKEHMSKKRLGNNKVQDEEEDLVDVLLKFHKGNLHDHTSTEFSLTTDNIKAIVFVSSFFFTIYSLHHHIIIHASICFVLVTTFTVRPNFKMRVDR